MMRAGLVLLCLASVALAGGKKGHAGPNWAKSWSDALVEGRALNLPIVVHRHGFY